MSQTEFKEFIKDENQELEEKLKILSELINQKQENKDKEELKGNPLRRSKRKKQM